MFKVGDLVECVISQFGNETVGKVYTVLKLMPGEKLDFWVERDDSGVNNSYDSRNFKLAKQKPDTFEKDKEIISRGAIKFLKK